MKLSSNVSFEHENRAMVACTEEEEGFLAVKCRPEFSSNLVVVFLQHFVFCWCLSGRCGCVISIIVKLMFFGHLMFVFGWACLEAEQQGASGVPSRLRISSTYSKAYVCCERNEGFWL